MVGENVLASHTPIDVIRFFDFVSPSAHQTSVFLNTTIATLLGTEKSAGTLYRLTEAQVTFFVLTCADSDLPADVPTSLPRAAERVFEDPDPDIVSGHENTLLYDCKLRMIRADAIRPHMELLVVAAHDRFVAYPRWKEAIIMTPDEFCYRRKMLPLESYAFLGFSGATVAEMCQEAVRLSPELDRFLRHFNPLPQSVLDR
jgi:hypothetical protein